MSDFLAEVREAVDARTPLALEEHLAPFAHLGGALDEILAPARLLVRGGKRLRAQMCAAGWLATGGEADASHPAVVHAGAALELFQACALVHDDVIDAAETRRGNPAAHHTFAATHKQRGWRGDADDFGVSAAILLGDVLLGAASSELALAAAAVPSEAAARARQIYDLMTIEVNVGQYLDVRAENLPWSTTKPNAAAREGVVLAEAPAYTSGPSGASKPKDAGTIDMDTADSLETVLTVVRHKSAGYSVEQPLALGVALAGADRTHEDALRKVGRPFGEAFQLRDDEIGVFGDPDTTGKPAGDDLREGKRTALLALTLSILDFRANEDDDRAERNAAMLRDRIGAPDLTQQEVERIRAIMVAVGAVDAHEHLVAERRTAGLTALEQVDTTPQARAVLEHMAELLTERQH